MKKNIIFILYILLFIPLMVYGENNQNHSIKLNGAFYPGCGNTLPMNGQGPSFLCQKYAIDDEEATCLDPDLSNPDFINTYEVLDTSTAFGRGLVAMSNFAKLNNVSSINQAHAYRIYTMKIDPRTGGGVIGPAKIGYMTSYSSSDSIGQMVNIGVCAAQNQSSCNGLNTEDFLPNSSGESLDGKFTLSKIDQNVSSNGENFIVTANVAVKKTDDNLELKPSGCNANGFECSITNNNINSDGTLQVKVSGKRGKTQSVKVYTKFSGGGNNSGLITEIGLYSCEPSKGQCIDLTISAEHSKRQWFQPYQRFIKLLTGNETTQDGDNYIIIDLPSVCDDPNLSDDEKLKNGCCDQIDGSKYADDSKEQDTYIKYCGPIVHTENDCGKDSCEDNSYKAFSHSYVRLRSMKYMLEDLQKGGSADDYLDRSINNYCGIYTTEKIDILTPATAASVSGQFFVFDSYNSTNYNNINSYFRQPYIVERVKASFFFNYNNWKSNYDSAISNENSTYNAWQTAVNNVKANYGAWQQSIASKNYYEGIKNLWENPSNSLPYSVCKKGNKNYNEQTCLVKKNNAYSDYNNSASSEENAKNSYNSAITAEKSAKSAYRTAVNKRIELQNQRDTCISESNSFKSSYNFNLDSSVPNVDFTYSQNSQKEGNKSYKISMVNNESAVKYWPNVTTNSSNTNYLGDKSIANNQTTTVSRSGYMLNGDNNELISYSFPNSSVDGCSGNKCTSYQYDGYLYSSIQAATNGTDPYGENITITSPETISKIYYFRPPNNTFALMNSGEYKTLNYESNAAHTTVNGLEIGYVYNIELTSYKGSYETSFAVSNYGYKTNSGRYLTQELLKKFNKLKDFSLDGSLASKCSYCNMEMAFKRNCDICDPNTTYDFEPQFYYRSISLADVTPTEREVETNWTDAKGTEAKKQIELGSGIANNSSSDLNNNYIAVATDNFKENKGNIATYLADSSTVGKHDIYDDTSREYLEYEVTLTSKDLQTIKRNSSRTYFNYAVMNMCTGNNSINSKDSDTEYCFICNSDMKECESSFISSYFSDTSGRNKWKYYVNGTFCTGNIKSCIKDLEYAEDGKYPDPLFTKQYLERYKNWP